MYDYLVVGSGLYGATVANLLHAKGKKVIVFEQRNHLAGNCHTDKDSYGNMIHRYGPHIFHTENKEVWDYASRFAKFNRYSHRVLAFSREKLYSYPINLLTLSQMFGVTDPSAARKIIAYKRDMSIQGPKNFEEVALSTIGEELYMMFLYGYTKKMWGINPSELDAELFTRTPIRYRFDDRYFNDKYQGIPIDGYTIMVRNMLKGVEVKLNRKFDYEKDKNIATTIIYSGSLDDIKILDAGPIPYRTLDIEFKEIETSDFQGNSVINYSDEAIPYTRITEYKHFIRKNYKKSTISIETPRNFSSDEDNIPFYAMPTEAARNIYAKYLKSIINSKNIIVGGRLGSYKNMNMDQVIEQAITLVKGL